MILLALALPALAGAGFPEVVRVRVPAEKVSTYFPPGTELRGMPLAEFEALVTAARDGYRRQHQPAGPRLLRARHAVRWEGGRLTGRSELLVEAGEPGPSPLVLDPWTPAIDPEAQAAVLNLPDGKTALRVTAPGTATVTLTWELRAQPETDGHVFALGLPRLDASALTLDLPAGWEPVGLPGMRQGPLPGSGQDRRSWRFDGPGGLATLRLHATAGPAAQAQAAIVWVGGPTRIDVDEAAARWRADWTIEPGPDAPPRIALLLDPGLDVVEASGPGVAGFQAEPTRQGTRLVIRLVPELSGRTPLVVTAEARVPAEGPWAVPAARPLDAIWTGSRTVVRLDSSRALEDCRERAGRRVAPRPDDPGDAARGGPVLVFEPATPSTVAELTFRGAPVEATAEVRGQLRDGGRAPRLDALLSWKVPRGRLLTCAADLSPGWTAERVQMLDGTDSIPWQAEAQPDGGTRIQIHPPPTADAGGVLTLVLSASAPPPPRTGSLALPRVRPVGVPLTDEVWVARKDPGTTLRPLSARGLAWIDPAPVAEDLARDWAEAVGPPGHLGWRWTSPEGRAQVALDRDPSPPTGTILQVAALDPDRLALEWRVTIAAADEPPPSLALAVTEPLPTPPQWRRLGAEDGPPLPARSLDAKARAALGLPAGGMAWEVELPGPRTGPVTLISRISCPWGGRGPLPLLALPARFRTRGAVLVLVDRAARSEAQATELHALDPGLAAQEFGTIAAEQGRYRRAHAFGYRGRPGRLVLQTEPLVPAGNDGVIAEALLRTLAPPGGPSRHRLTLRVATTGTRSLDVDLPRDATLQRAQSDGRPVTPVLLGAKHRFPLPGGPDDSAHANRDLTTLVLDYQTPRGLSPSAAELKPEWPRFSLPCLSLGWEVAVPAPWEVAAASPDLVAADPIASPSRLGRFLGNRAVAGAGAASETMLKDLDARAEAGPSGATTLGQRLLRWDAGRWPVVVDRAALAAAGVGPDTRHETRPGRAIGARAALEPMGLTVVPLGGVLLVTTGAEAPAQSASAREREAWDRALRAAVAFGADPSDRFQAVVRWLGEPSPPGPAQAEAGMSLTGKWARRRFQVSGMPAAGAELVLVDTWSRAVGGGGVALAIVTLAVALRNLPERRLARGLIAALIAAQVAVSWIWYDAAAQAAGIVGGSLAVAASWLVRTLRARLRKRRAGRRTASSIRRRTAPGISMALALALAAGLAASRLAADPADAPAPADAPILALLPYDGLPDLADPDQRVLLLLKDHDRLKAWSEVEPAPPGVTIGATAASHRVDRDRAPDLLRVESRYELWVTGEGATSWDIPVGEARDLEATLDGQEVPALIRPGGQTAVVPVAGAGRHRLEVRRSLPRRPTEAGEELSLPINPMASARVAIGAPPEGLALDLRGARGSIAAGPDEVEAALGPAGRLEVRWLAPERAARPDDLATVEGLLLWDVEPAGDRLRARWTIRHPGGTARVRLALEPGLIVRAAERSSPGVLDASGAGTAERPEWVARFDPPLADGETLSAEFWRPTAAPAGAKPADRSAARWPRVELLGVGRSAGLVGFRRPADWTGRLGPLPGTEAVSDEAFVRAWGTLPREPLTLAGTTRFSGLPPIRVATGPVPPRPAIVPAVRLEIVPGRVNVRVDAELIDRGGRSFEVRARIAEGLSLTRVEADGLTHWSRPAADVLRLRFDGAEAPPRRMIHLEGWLAVEADPMALGEARREVIVPWPRWPGAEEAPGILAVVGPSSIQLPIKEAAGGVKRTTADPTAAARLAFQVERPEALGRLSWAAEPPRVDVSARSQLRLDPGSASWTARVDYQVSGGALDAIRFKVPSAWAAVARVEVVGGGHRLTAEVLGEATVWTIRPETPIWGTRRIVVRASRAWSGSDPLTFPDLIPLGRGTVETYLALVDASGRPLEVEGSRGIDPVDGSRYPPEDDGGGPATSRRVYRVRQEGWSLRVRAPEAPGRSGAEEARLLLADVGCVLAADGTAWGEACLEVEPGSGAFATVVLPGEAEAVAAAVDGRPVRPMRGAAGRWLVPLGDGTARRVDLVWHAGRVSSSGGARTVPLPGLVQEGVPLLVTILAPASWAVEAPAGPLRREGPGALEAERAAGLRQRIAAALEVIDRGSVAQHQALVDALAWFEVRARSAEREARWGAGERSPQPVLGRLEVVRRRLAEDLRLAGLDALLPEARARIAISPEASAPFRVRRLGHPRHFLGASGSQGRPPLIRFTAPAPSPAEG